MVQKLKEKKEKYKATDDGYQVNHLTDDIFFANFNDQAVSFSKTMPKNPHVSADVLKVVTTAFETVFLWYPRRCQKI